MPSKAVSLRDAGFRLVWRKGACTWVHPAEMQDSDDDCTDMSDDDFGAFIANQPTSPP